MTYLMFTRYTMYMIYECRILFCKYIMYIHNLSIDIFVSMVNEHLMTSSQIKLIIILGLLLFKLGIAAPDSAMNYFYNNFKRKCCIYLT